jgi:hypothetical protein
MAITQVIDALPAGPDPATDTPSTFSTKAVASVAAQRAMVPQINTAIAQINATAAGLNAIASGGAYAIPYVFNTESILATNGYLTVDNPSAQSSTGHLYLNKIASGNFSADAIIATFDDSTSPVKGFIRITKMGDASKWMLLNVTGATPYANYWELNSAVIASSSANPFATGDALILQFTRNGDAGAAGAKGDGFGNIAVLTTSQTWTCPAGITRAEITVVDGGQGGAGYSGSPTSMGPGGKGGNAGASIVTITPGTVYTATVGAGSAGTTSGSLPAAGGASSFAGAGLTTVTSANAMLKVPGGDSGFYADNVRPGNGGGTMLAPPASTGYGAGGKGGDGAIGGNGRNGVVIIRF